MAPSSPPGGKGQDLWVDVVVASQGAGIGSLRIRNWLGSVRRDDADIEIDQPFSRDTAVSGAEAVTSVARGAREAIVDVPSVLDEGGVGDDICEIVALSAKRVGAIHA